MSKVKLLTRFWVLGLILCVLIYTHNTAAESEKNVMVVDNDGAQCQNADFKKIQDAINAVSSGGEIEVCEGNYDEQLVISKSLKIVGKTGAILAPTNVRANSKDLAMDEDLASIVLVKEAKEVEVEGFIINGEKIQNTQCEPGIAGVVFLDASGEVRNINIKQINQARSQTCENDFGIFVQSSDQGEAEVIVEGSKIHNLGKKSIVGANLGTVVRAKENVIVGTKAKDNDSYSGVFLDFGATGTMQGNKIATSE